MKKQKSIKKLVVSATLTFSIISSCLGMDGAPPGRTVSHYLQGFKQLSRDEQERAAQDAARRVRERQTGKRGEGAVALTRDERIRLWGEGAGSEAEERKSCSICSENLIPDSGDRLLYLLPCCNNFIHKDCADNWFRTHDTCPVCRSEGTKAGKIEVHARSDQDLAQATVQAIAPTIVRAAGRPEDVLRRIDVLIDNVFRLNSVEARRVATIEEGFDQEIFKKSYARRLEAGLNELLESGQIPEGRVLDHAIQRFMAEIERAQTGVPAPAAAAAAAAPSVIPVPPASSVGAMPYPGPRRGDRREDYLAAVPAPAAAAAYVAPRGMAPVGRSPYLNVDQHMEGQYLMTGPAPRPVSSAAVSAVPARPASAVIPAPAAAAAPAVAPAVLPIITELKPGQVVGSDGIVREQYMHGRHHLMSRQVGRFQPVAASAAAPARPAPAVAAVPAAAAARPDLSE